MWWTPNAHVGPACTNGAVSRDDKMVVTKHSVPGVDKACQSVVEIMTAAERKLKLCWGGN